MDYLVQEDGVSRFELEDGSGFLLLETVPEFIGRAVRVLWQVSTRRLVWVRSGRFFKW